MFAAADWVADLAAGGGSYLRGLLRSLHLPRPRPYRGLPRRWAVEQNKEVLRFTIKIMKLPPAAADTILLYSLFKKSDEGKPSCDFTNQKVWILIWATLNILAVVGLLVALCNDYYILPSSPTAFLLVHECL